MDWKIKYIKYKTKYLKLRLRINDEIKIGGGIKSAQNQFYEQISKNKNKIYKFLSEDNYLNNIISTENFPQEQLSVNEIKNMEFFKNMHIRVATSSIKLDIS